jgi:uncharacterized protein YgbK (DUF1537 family)
MNDLAIIADDLTGAADAAAAFTQAGLSSYVLLGGATFQARVVAIDTDSRSLPEDAAAQRVHAAATEAYRQGTRILYKKIDSTLRGNTAAEIAAAWRAAADRFGSALVVVAPASPLLGRTMRGGRVLVHGVPLEQTEVWRASGMTGAAELSAMLALRGLKTVHSLPGADLPPGTQAVVCDAESEEDLRRIALLGAAYPGAVIWAGSAGLARHLPAALRLARAEQPATCRRLEGPILTLVGSRSSLAREQAQALGVESFALHPVSLAVDEPGIARALSLGRDVLVQAGEGEVDLRRAPLLAAALGRLAAVHAHRLSGLIATGGDIARAALEALGANGLRLLGELEPGVALGIADAPRPLRVVTKAGAFGTRETLLRSLLALKAGQG